MVTSDSTQIIDPEFGFYGPMGFNIGAFLGNLLLAFFAQDGHADQYDDRKIAVPKPACLEDMLSKYLGKISRVFTRRYGAEN
ncbi:hypothetical protein QQ045_032000 [Rhodiola kirilowii]